MSVLFRVLEEIGALKWLGGDSSILFADWGSTKTGRGGSFCQISERYSYLSAAVASFLCQYG